MKTLRAIPAVALTLASLVGSGCATGFRMPGSSQEMRAPERQVEGRELQQRMSTYLVPLDESGSRFLKMQFSEIGLIHTDETQISSWKAECMERQVRAIHEVLSDATSAGRKQVEALQIEGIDYLLADLSEHGEASDVPLVRKIWWDAGDQPGLVVRMVYDPREPSPDAACRVLKPSSFERQLKLIR